MAAQSPASRDSLFGQPHIVPNSPALVKSIGDAAEYLLRWHPPTDAVAWKQRRPEVERALLRSLGLDPLPVRTPLHSRSVARSERRGFSVETVVFESRPDFPIPANLYRPTPGGAVRRPAILVPIGHYLAEGKTATEVQAICQGLAKEGFITLTYDAIGHGERMIPGNVHHEAGYALLPLGQTIAGWMVWDSMRALDYLETLPEVDPSRIGITGVSGGGLNSLLTAALDQRVQAAAVVGFTFEFNNWIKYGGNHCACTHLPGIFRSMEWFEIASLVAPRPLLLLQGEYDDIFPIAGARRAASHTQVAFELLRAQNNFRFEELAGEPHAYSRPFRERAYGWMAAQLMHRGDGSPIAEPKLDLSPEQDPQLLCGSGDARIAHQRTVVDMGREKASALISALAPTRDSVLAWVGSLTRPAAERPGFLSPRATVVSLAEGVQAEEIGFFSEDGEYVPGTLWRPAGEHAPAPVLIVADDRGRAQFAQQPMARQLAGAGYAVLAVDLRGRGETLAHFGPEWDGNYRLVSSQILFGRPLPGMRAFDLLRTLDYVATRPELSRRHISVAGLGDDALPALLTAAVDPRVEGVAVTGYFQSFASQMRAMQVPPGDRAALRRLWNSAQAHGRIPTGAYEVDFGSVIPSVLTVADIADIVGAIAPRAVLVRQARDCRDPYASRLQRLARAADWPLDYQPEKPLDAATLLGWLRERQQKRIRLSSRGPLVTPGKPASRADHDSR